MKMKKILAAIAACAMSAAMLGMTVSAAPVENPNETLEDDDPADNGDITLDDGEEPADFGFEEPDDGEEPANDTVDTPTVPSPQTGNSPIALAVIPVALAAAAVVAKKAK